MEGKSNSVNHMGDVVLSPLQQQNYGGGPHSPASVSSGVDIGKGVVRMPTITFDNVIAKHVVVEEEQPEESEEDLQEQLPGNANRKKGFRKRKKSNAVAGGNDGNYLPPYKHRRMFIRRHTSCPSGAGGLPLKFLLGGNAHDPLNLNGLGDSDNAVTPKTSPMPGLSSQYYHHHHQKEIPIMIPKNYKDPLRLMSEEDVENTRDVIEGILPEPPTQPPHKRRRHRKRSLRKRNASECSVESRASDEGEEDVEAAAAEVIAKCDIRELTDEDETVEVINQGGSKKVSEETFILSTEIKVETPSSNKRKHDSLDEGKGKGTETDIPVQLETNGPVPTAADDKGKASPQAVMADLEPTFPFRVSSEYIPLSSHYQPSPFVLDTMNENFTVLPFESPSMSNYMGTQDTFTITEPFSPPPRPMNMDVIIEHRVPSGHYGLGWTPPRNEIQRRELPRPPTVTQQAMFNRRHRHRLDPIVSPVFPNLSSGKRSWTLHSHSHPRHNHKNKQQEGKVVEEDRNNEKEVPNQEQGKKPDKKFRAKDEIFRFGNYNQYYGYRNNGQQEDARLRALKKEWLEGKDILDIGCNVGHVTLSIARDCAPRRIVGIDIDGYLIKVANKNVKHYVDRDPNDVSIKFPQALSIIHGTLQPPQLEAVAVGCTPEHAGTSGMSTSGGTSAGELPRKRIPFPYNVCFRQENYVLDADDLLCTVKSQYDVITCLSTTKWVHLNFGDEGLKRFFRRAYANLRADGLFILEPQPWSSYKKKKKLTEEIFKTFQSIKFQPKDFESFLLKEVGYTSVQLVGIPAHHSKGFQRPIYVFTKGGGKPVATSSSGTSGAAGSDEMKVLGS